MPRPEAAAAVIFDDIAEKDWVKASLEGLGLVRAGRFAVMAATTGTACPATPSASRSRRPWPSAPATGTTRGCLLMLDGILKPRRPRRVLDVGTGTGVLAMAAARALHRPVASGDIDPVAVEAARENALNNRAGAYVRPVVARGVGHPVLAAGKPYDLVFANILARPLMRLAPSIASIVAPGGEIILSGLIPRDVPGVLSAYRAQRLHLVRKMELEGWATLLLRAGGAGGRRLG